MTCVVSISIRKDKWMEILPEKSNDPRVDKANVINSGLFSFAVSWEPITSIGRLERMAAPD
jgi:hypothetical protein